MSKRKPIAYSKKDIQSLLEDPLFANIGNFYARLERVYKGEHTLKEMFKKWRSTNSGIYERSVCKLIEVVMLEEPYENLPLFLNGIPEQYYTLRKQTYRISTRGMVNIVALLARYRIKKGV